jgi:hypothetical protein
MSEIISTPACVVEALAPKVVPDTPVTGRLYFLVKGLF